MDRAQARREDAEAIARLVNSVTVAEIASGSTVEEVRDGLTSPLSANEGVIVAAGPSLRPFRAAAAAVDLAPTVLAALDAPSRVEHTGRVLHELVGSDANVGRSEPKPAVQIPGMPTGEGSSASATPRPTRWRSTSEVSGTSSSRRTARAG